MTLLPQQQEHQPGNESRMMPRPQYMRANYKGSGKLQDKVALITGGDSGIGRAVAIHFAREGSHVAIAYKPEEQSDADLTRHLVEQEGSRCLLLPGDLRHAPYCEHIVAQTVEKFGKLNIVVSNAAEQFTSTDVAELPNEQFEDTFQVNFFPLVRVVKAAVPHLHESDSIIATSSINAYRGNQQLVDYSATKGAITPYIRSIAQQLAERKFGPIRWRRGPSGRRSSRPASRPIRSKSSARTLP